MADEKVPEGHGIGMAEPSGQNDPGSHARHVSCPAVSWYEPAVHGVHVPAPTLGATVPAEHGVWSMLPVAAK